MADSRLAALRAVPGLASDITTPFSSVEAFLYDVFVAPYVAEVADDLADTETAPIPEGGRVLDVGCGGGQIAIRLAERRPDLRVSGLDLSSDQVSRAVGRAGDVSDRVDFTVGSALDLPFDDITFDFVMSVASIKHWPDSRAGLDECVRVLRPGGHLLVAEIDRGCAYEDAERFVDGTRVPWPVRIPFLMAFRTFVAGRSLDMDDARDLAGRLGLAEHSVERYPGLPAWVIHGRR